MLEAWQRDVLPDGDPIRASAFLFGRGLIAYRTGDSERALAFLTECLLELDLPLPRRATHRSGTRLASLWSDRVLALSLPYNGRAAEGPLFHWRRSYEVFERGEQAPREFSDWLDRASREHAGKPEGMAATIWLYALVLEGGGRWPGHLFPPEMRLATRFDETAPNWDVPRAEARARFDRLLSTAAETDDRDALALAEARGMRSARHFAVWCLREDLSVVHAAATGPRSEKLREVGEWLATVRVPRNE